METRLIALYDGTCCIDEFFVIETNAPEERLKELEAKCLDIALNGGSKEEVPSWLDELTDEGFTFDFVDGCDNPDAKEWLAAEYPDVTEIYTKRYPAPPEDTYKIPMPYGWL